MTNSLKASISLLALALTLVQAFSYGTPTQRRAVYPGANPAKPTADTLDDIIVLNKIIAKVDNYYVLKSDLDEAIQSYGAQGQKAPQPCQLLESLVINKMMLAKAEIDSVVVDDKQVDKIGRASCRERVCSTV